MFTSHVDHFFAKAKCTRYIVSQLQEKNAAFGVAATQSSYSMIVDQMIDIISETVFVVMFQPNDRFIVVLFFF